MWSDAHLLPAHFLDRGNTHFTAVRHRWVSFFLYGACWRPLFTPDGLAGNSTIQISRLCFEVCQAVTLHGFQILSKSEVEHSWSWMTKIWSFHAGSNCTETTQKCGAVSQVEVRTQWNWLQEEKPLNKHWRHASHLVASNSLCLESLAM